MNAEASPFCPIERAETIRSVKSFQRPDLLTSIGQTVSTVGALLVCYAVLLVGLAHGHRMVLLLAPVATGLAIRTFTLQHDCGHGSLFPGARANALVGRLCSLLTLTPYDHWRSHHALHHGGWNNIDSRGRLSDIYSDCITISEYHAMTSMQKAVYRLSKHPVIALLLMPPIIFFIVYRIPFDTPSAWRRERLGVHLTNLCLVLLYGGLGYAFGFATVGLVTLCVIYPASIIGVWLFLVQHKFEGVHWVGQDAWDPFEASLTGCSFLRLPAILNWFSGSIGLHHIHHAAPGIPNYRLADCHEAHAVFQNVKTIGFREAVREIASHTLWDDVGKTMVPFHIARRRPPETAAAAACG